MSGRRTAMLLGSWVIVGAACSVTVDGGPDAPVEPVQPVVGEAAALNDVVPSTVVVETTTVAPAAGDPPEATPSATSEVPQPVFDEPSALNGVYDPSCVVEVQEGDTLDVIADRFDDETVDAAALRSENGFDVDQVVVGLVIDVCTDNGLNDISGVERTDPTDAELDLRRQAEVRAQQYKLNQLFAGLGIRELLVDGISGPVTRQRLCAARLALGLPVTRTDMDAGSEEEQLLFATDELPLPYTTALLSERWILIDRTCQIMFVGEGDDELTFVFNTSTGEAGYETRSQDRTRAFRYNPANGNGGWHNSTTYPVAADNPLNGNMYRPLYFDNGQAIHGSNNVPTSPQSKGCARLRVGDQDLLVEWLGLGGIGGPTNSSSRINVTVNVQGSY